MIAASANLLLVIFLNLNKVFFYPAVWVSHEAGAALPDTLKAKDSKQLASALRKAFSACLAI
jgi:hypothetical protein